MDTTERITILCDGDKSLTNSNVAAVRKWVTVGQLQGEYTLYNWCENVEKAMVAMGDAFRELSEKMYKVFVGQSFKKRKILSELWEFVQNELDRQLESREERNKYRRLAYDNFPKINCILLVRRLNCRRRQRESRRSYVRFQIALTILDDDSLAEPEPG